MIFIRYPIPDIVVVFSIVFCIVLCRVIYHCVVLVCCSVTLQFVDGTCEPASR